MTFAGLLLLFPDSNKLAVITIYTSVSPVWRSSSNRRARVHQQSTQKLFMRRQTTNPRTRTRSGLRLELGSLSCSTTHPPLASPANRRRPNPTPSLYSPPHKCTPGPSKTSRSRTDHQPTSPAKLYRTETPTATPAS